MNLIAFAMFATAMRTKPSATCSALTSRPVTRPICWASARNFSSAAPVTRRARNRARGFGTDAIALAVEAQDRSAAGGDRVDRQHRRAQAHAGDERIELALAVRNALAREVPDIGGGAAHVETDDLV